jgi:hypothetical protein
MPRVPPGHAEEVFDVLVVEGVVDALAFAAVPHEVRPPQESKLVADRR